MVELLIDNIFVEFGGHIVQQNIGIPMGKNGVAHIVDRFLYPHDAYKHLSKTTNYMN